MHRLLQKLGISGTVASVLMIAFGVLIWIYPDMLAKLIAIYLVVVGVVKLIPEKT